MIGPNNAFEEELYYQYLKDPKSVSKEWQEYFSRVHSHAGIPDASSPQAAISKDDEYILKENEELEVLSPIQEKISQNMEESLEVPTATSVRTIPVKALDENRRIINKYLQKVKRPRVSFTHVVLWAVVRALVKFPHLNDTMITKDGKAHRVKRKSINVGLAVDLVKKDGSRLLLVPNVKNAQNLNFSSFIDSFNNIIEKSRDNKLLLEDLQDTTVTLTNPGMIGTSFSAPRLMKGQGMILAVGAIDYPTEFQAVSPEVLTNMAVSKVVTMTNTYDHRIIQGAESAEFLDYINRLLLGEKHFYDQIFAALKIPFEPIRWQTDYKKMGFSEIHKHDIQEKGAHVMQLINAYRVRGHLLATVNPLGFESYYYPELDPAYYGFSIWDLDRVFHADDTWMKNNLPLRDIIELLRETYCGHMGFEFMHIQAPERKNWVKRYLETTRNSRVFSNEEKKEIYNKLVEAESFENFLHTKFVGHKRFSLEGSESVIILIDRILSRAANSNLDSAVIGMAHRGRLNVLVNNIGKKLENIFNEFEEDIDTSSYYGANDVKYHLGAKGKYKSDTGREMEILLSPNPSHLELVNPVVEGMARAKDNNFGDKSHSNTLPILLHGDAAFAGQGIVAETLNLSELHGYKTGGTIHIIINNQIGFTTTSEASRSTIYATDIAKMIQVPIIHVNGNDPESVISAAIFASEYRKNFNSDVIIDILSYRKYGHNEADEPSYTQPLLYKKIKSMKAVRSLYETELLKEEVISKTESETIQKNTKERLEDAFNNRKERKEKREKLIKYEQGEIFKEIDTKTSLDDLRKIGKAISHEPEDFDANSKVVKFMKSRAKMMESEKPAIDWSMAEALAFGSLLIEGIDIRFSGEDTRRGTFSQRHAVLTDINTEDEFIPLNNIKDKQGTLRIFDSPLSELAVLGFEYGYSVVANNTLTLWEAQFGDFTNMAQPILDQFISCAEYKWGQFSNLVMLLPHSYDGQGAEHSSARLERHLQLCAEENMIVANLTTPANYFHILRRQMKMYYKKPLILMTPKSMLRNPEAVSSLDEISTNSFQTLIDSDAKDKSKVKRIFLSTGKIYYELKAKLKEDMAIVRVEQIYPFDTNKAKEILAQYPNAKEIVWIQEEPKNMGAWNFLAPYLYDLIQDGQKLKYIGRKESSSTAPGTFKVHEIEQNEFLNKAVSEDLF